MAKSNTVQKQADTSTAPRQTGKNGRFTDIGERENLSAIMEKFKTKSAAMRYLWNEGYERGAIAMFLDVKYQFVRNVLERKPKKAATSEPTNAPV